MKNYEKLKEAAYERLGEYEAVCRLINDDLADHPEVSGKEYESSRKIVKLLNKEGYQTEAPYAGYDTAFKAVYGDNNHSRKIALLTEYDALPGIGHACGHCTSAAISLLTGLSLKELQEELDADIHIIGTPVEETDGAKCTMVKNGVFDEYDMALMVHLYDENILAPKLQALNSYLYTFHGKPAHASAAPWDGNNALNGVQLMFHALDMLRQHVKPDVRIHGVIRDGGLAPNIVPESASAEFYIRSMDRHYLTELLRKVEDCAKGAAIATQTSYQKKLTAESYDNLKANPTGEGVLSETYAELGLELGNPDRIFGSSDAGNVSMICPTFHPTLQIVEPGVAIHTREFAEAVKSSRAHRAIADGAKILTLQILKIFTDSKKFEAMKEDFNQ
ncbi:M20 family metallopeptidase [Clostridium aminobutyricum]|uniref:Peptidase M20 domain-containing protein 2 n=1 Tax=Clostridium aminobutyricum TaxID=33953 RepID=A0A939D7T3_CLOAM|nr:M20 family metallopeptidase [Clostridium aminobutyricum]MBN7773014.1 M20 family metallopeptidase [Clostridium aminobutyricum]